MNASSVEYMFLRYVPNVINGEGVSIAAVFIDPVELEQGICMMSFAANWEGKVRHLDPTADLEMLRALFREIRDRLLSKDERPNMIRQLGDSFSNVVQVSERRKCPVTAIPDTIEAFGHELLEKASKISDSSSQQHVPRCAATL
jgi:hypothetical protein